MSLGENIRQLRELRNIKRPYMAGKLGIGVTAYGNLERGRTKIDDDRKKKIADILGVTPEELELFNAEQAIHTITNGDNSPIWNIGSNSTSMLNEHQAELMEVHKQTVQTLEKVALLLDKALDKLGK